MLSCICPSSRIGSAERLLLRREDDSADPGGRITSSLEEGRLDAHAELCTVVWMKPLAVFIDILIVLPLRICI